MSRPAIFILDTMDSKGNHEERYLSIPSFDGKMQITSWFFREILNYFNRTCDDCAHNGHVAVDVTRIFDNGIQVYFDSENDIEER